MFEPKRATIARTIQRLFVPAIAAIFAWPAAAQLDVASLADGDPPPPLTINAAGLFDLHVRDIDLSEVLRMLSRRAERNVSVSPGISGRVRIDLYQVSFSETLAALLRPKGFVWYEQDGFINVCQRVD